MRPGTQKPFAINSSISAFVFGNTTGRRMAPSGPNSNWTSSTDGLLADLLFRHRESLSLSKAPTYSNHYTSRLVAEVVCLLNNHMAYVPFRCERQGFDYRLGSDLRETLSRAVDRKRRLKPTRDLTPMFVTNLPQQQNGCQTAAVMFVRNGRDDWIRTSDLTHPKRARYQAAPRPVSLINYPANEELSNSGRPCVRVVRVCSWLLRPPLCFLLEQRQQFA